MTHKDPSLISDNQLVKKALEDVENYSFLVERYETKLKFYILRISNFSYEETQEILQEVFIKVWKNLREFDDSLKFSSWIYRIAHNETISEYRKKETRGQDKQVFLEEDLFHNIPSGLDIPQETDRSINVKIVHQVLALLPKNYREILILRFFEDKNYDEISDILKKPSGTVATLLHRAKQAFYEQVQRQKIDFSNL